MRYCQYCGEPINESDKFCPNCGKVIAVNEQQPVIIYQNTYQTSPAKAPKKKKKTALYISIIALILAAVAAAAIFLSNGSGLFSRRFSEDTKAIAAASSSVVRLNCYDKSGELYATGSGFVMFDQHTIVTNYHVIADNVYKIQATADDGSMFNVEYVIAYDDERDIALLKSNTSLTSPTLEYTTKTPEKGETVVAIGSPRGLLNSISTGVYSGYRRDDGLSYLQFTAAISPGSSGGPLFNDEGKVIGVTSEAYTDAQNLNLAVPIKAVVDMWVYRASYTSMTIQQFYDMFIHPVSVREAYRSYHALDDDVLGVKGYVSFVWYYDDSVFCGIVDNASNVLGYYLYLNGAGEVIEEFKQCLFNNAVLIDISSMLNDYYIDTGMYIAVVGYPDEMDASAFAEYFGKEPNTKLILRDCYLIDIG